jgi:hypothetical protein
MSHGPSTRCHRITNADFRLCSTCSSRSQAPLCVCTLRLVSIQPEGTFARLRYSLGGDRPSQTAHLTLFPHRLTAKVRAKTSPEWYFTGDSTEPGGPASTSPTYPTQASPNPMSGYSKAPRGLFVQLRVKSIFTPISVSPGPLLRQCSSRYAFRAGRNLPDKEFRYLRTVIVTAAVHRGFGSQLSPLPLTFRHWAGVSLYTSSCDFAQTCVFGKQSLEPFLCGPLSFGMLVASHPTRAPLLPKLRG